MGGQEIRELRRGMEALTERVGRLEDGGGRVGEDSERTLRARAADLQVQTRGENVGLVWPFIVRDATVTATQARVLAGRLMAAADMADMGVAAS